MNKEQLMKTKAKALYEFLLKYPDEYVSEEAICSVLGQQFPPSINRQGHTTLNRTIWNAVQYINNSKDEFPMIVINDRHRKYKIANAEDLRTYLGREHKLLSKKYKRLNQITYKASLNGVADLTSYDNQGDLKTLNTILSNRGSDNASQTS